jgi:hypothetical protein
VNSMKKTMINWKKGRGKLGALTPLIGSWEAKADTPIGFVRCTREFTPILNGTYIQLLARWEFKKGVYEERAVYGLNNDKKLAFWSFTSDGKNSQGIIADVSDVHSQAIGFEAQMSAGLARMVYWPNDLGGMNWIVEAKTKKGWNRFTEHHYFPK